MPNSKTGADQPAAQIPAHRRRNESVQIAPENGEPRTISIEEFVYRVAVHAWKDGLTANAITRKLFSDRSALHLMQVKRALQRALNANVLRLVPPPATELGQKLDQLVNGTKAQDDKSRIELHVVLDNEQVEGAPVYAMAAELISTHIVEALRRVRSSKAKDRIVICNAGGRTVTETVRALARNPPILDEFEDDPAVLQKLLFVAGNAAYEPTQLNLSANFLSVTMAELFAADHLALPKVENEKVLEEHANRVAQASLFVCGVGTCRGEQNLSLLMRYFKDRGWKMPPAAAGDLAFNLLDRHGRKVDFPTEASREFMRQLNPSLDLSTIMDIASKQRVLIVLDSVAPTEKAEIGMAVLRRRYASDVVLGSRLATEIIRIWDGAP